MAKYESKSTNKRARNGFVSFWLILNLIFILSLIIFVVVSEYVLELDNEGDFDIIEKILAIPFCLILASFSISIILLLFWKKAGFYLYIGTYFIFLLLCFLIGISILILPLIIWVIIMIIVLNIKRDGKSIMEEIK